MALNLRKATPAEKAEYAETKPVYPLYGFVNVDGHRCFIEDCGRNAEPGEPRYEIMAPHGHCFDGELHYALEPTLEFLKGDAQSFTVVRCEHGAEGPWGDAE